MSIRVGVLDVAFDPPPPRCVIEAVGSVTFGDERIENTLRIDVRNNDVDWVTVVIETVDDPFVRLLDTPRIDPGLSRMTMRGLPADVAGRTVRIFRWAPGFLGLPGSGGGEARTEIPREGAVRLVVTCVRGA
ncbi:hypothetical protein WCD74_16475 [Actinomycetospora sp. OC33-EN08]|uniref:Uncharacterized protein n=1 Tax=Actinomycetospora aurantiaca TaxID=3129233 RepID=A0ABU8MPX4_9PSEU